MLKYIYLIAVMLFVGVCIGMLIVNLTNADNSSASTDDFAKFSGAFDDKATPSNYLKNGDFYLEGKPFKLTVDASLMNRVGSALYWYDKVISEYPKTNAANQALKNKIQALIGWSEGYGDNKKSYGLKMRTNAAVYFPMLEDTYTKLEMDYPEDVELSAFAYQIAQEYFFYFYVYSKQKYIEQTKKWMTKVVELANNKETFYSHLAKHHLSIVARHDK